MAGWSLLTWMEIRRKRCAAGAEEKVFIQQSSPSAAIAIEKYKYKRRTRMSLLGLEDNR
jgi:hypothetical protein